MKEHYLKQGIPVQFQMERVPTEESNDHYNFELTYVMKVNYVQLNNARKISVFCKNLKRVTPEESAKNHKQAREMQRKQDEEAPPADGQETAQKVSYVADATKKTPEILELIEPETSK